MRVVYFNVEAYLLSFLIVVRFFSFFFGIFFSRNSVSVLAEPLLLIITIIKATKLTIILYYRFSIY